VLYAEQVRLLPGDNMLSAGNAVASICASDVARLHQSSEHFVSMPASKSFL